MSLQQNSSTFVDKNVQDGEELDISLLGFAYKKSAVDNDMKIT